MTTWNKFILYLNVYKEIEYFTILTYFDNDPLIKKYMNLFYRSSLICRLSYYTYYSRFKIPENIKIKDVKKIINLKLDDKSHDRYIKIMFLKLNS